jgi:hypothetical protein
VAERWEAAFDEWRTHVAAGLHHHFNDDWPGEEFLQSSSLGTPTRLFTPYERLQQMSARGETAIKGGLKVLRLLHDNLVFAVNGRAPGAANRWHRLLHEPNQWVLAIVTGVLAIITAVIAGVILTLLV